MEEFLYIAVDLGAGSGRVFLVGCAPGELLLEEVRRFYYPPRRAGGHLRWDFAHILDEIKTGLGEAGQKAKELGRPIRSIGIDSWAVDYGLVGSGGELLNDPVCYRDERTAGAMEKVFTAVAGDKIFEKTGIQFLPFNTVFQLSAENGDISQAAQMLMIPDLINYFLTGRAVTEYTNSTTTQMVNAATGEWDRELVAALNLPERILTKIVASGTDLGTLKPELAAQTGLENVRVIAPATHDTASAVVGAPLKDRWAFISSGTWSLVGVERNSPLINDEVQKRNFTNEGGAFGTIRFLKNVAGLWLLESCRKEWRARGIDTDYETLLEQVAEINRFPGFIFPDDPRFLNPKSMLSAIAKQLKETGQDISSKPVIVAKVILDSLAFRYASVVQTIEKLTGEKIAGVQIVGGGSRNNYLNQMTANACRLPVISGPAEATVIGNAMVQAIAAGRFSSLERARKHVAQNVKLQEFAPRALAGLTQAARDYAAIESAVIES